MSCPDCTGGIQIHIGDAVEELAIYKKDEGRKTERVNATLHLMRGSRLTRFNLKLCQCITSRLQPPQPRPSPICERCGNLHPTGVCQRELTHTSGGDQGASRHARVEHDLTAINEICAAITGANPRTISALRHVERVCDELKQFREATGRVMHRLVFDLPDCAIEMGELFHEGRAVISSKCVAAGQAELAALEKCVEGPCKATVVLTFDGSEGQPPNDDKAIWFEIPEASVSEGSIESECRTLFRSYLKEIIKAESAALGALTSKCRAFVRVSAP